MADRDVATFQICNINETVTLTLNNALVADTLSTETEKPTRNEDLQKFDHLRDLEVNELENSAIGVLIDSKFARHFFLGNARTGGEDEPIAIETDFGFTMIGPNINSNDSENNEDTENDMYLIDADYEKLNENILTLFRHDFILPSDEYYPSEVAHPSVNDEYAEKQFQQSVKFENDLGRYSLCLPWIDGREESAAILNEIDFQPNSLNRLNKLKIKLQRNEKLKIGAFAQMRSNIENGYATIIDDESKTPGCPVSYLPNHIVLHRDKPGKVRITQDAASKVRNVSVNRLLAKGKDRLKALVILFIDFRAKKVVVTADITEFFYQIRVDEGDRGALRFHWWSDENFSKVITLQANIHIFGLRSSPGVAAFIMEHHANMVKEMYPQNVFEAFLKLYVDDLAKGFDDTPEGVEFKKNFKKACADGGFKIIKWRSNVPELNDPVVPPIQASQNDGEKRVAVANADRPTNSRTEKDKKLNKGALNDGQQQTGVERVTGAITTRDQQPLQEQPEQIFEEEQEQEEEEFDENHPGLDNLPPDGECSLRDFVDKVFNEDEYDRDVLKNVLGEPNEKILGIGYSYENDELHIRIGDRGDRQIKTKRDVLAWISSLYDPAGYLSPFVLLGRQFFQQINEDGTDWKEPVREDILTAFNKYKESVIHLKNIRIPRWTNILGIKDVYTQLIIFSDASKTGFGFVSYNKEQQYQTKT